MSGDAQTPSDTSAPAEDTWPETIRQLEEIRRLEQRVAGLKRGLLQGGGTTNSRRTSAGSTLLLVRLGARLAALPMNRVEEVARMTSLTPTDAGTDAVLGLADYHGTPVAVLDPRAVLGEPMPPIQATQVMVFCQLPRLLVAIRVDEVVNVVRVEAKDCSVTEEVLPGGLRSAAVARTPEGMALVLEPLMVAVAAELDALNIPTGGAA